MNLREREENDTLYFSNIFSFILRWIERNKIETRELIANSPNNSNILRADITWSGWTWNLEDLWRVTGSSRRPISWRSAGRVRDLRAAIKSARLRISNSEAAIDGKGSFRPICHRVHLPYVETASGQRVKSCLVDSMLVRSFSFFLFFLPLIRSSFVDTLARVRYAFELASLFLVNSYLKCGRQLCVGLVAIHLIMEIKEVVLDPIENRKRESSLKISLK